jgi:hypothetical protein
MDYAAGVYATADAADPMNDGAGADDGWDTADTGVAVADPTDDSADGGADDASYSTGDDGSDDSGDDESCKLSAHKPRLQSRLAAHSRRRRRRWRRR